MSESSPGGRGRFGKPPATVVRGPPATARGGGVTGRVVAPSSDDDSGAPRGPTSAELAARLERLVRIRPPTAPLPPSAPAPPPEPAPAGVAGASGDCHTDDADEQPHDVDGTSAALPKPHHGTSAALPMHSSPTSAALPRTLNPPTVPPPPPGEDRYSPQDHVTVFDVTVTPLVGVLGITVGWSDGRILSIAEKSWAEGAGLWRGDVIQAIDGKSVGSLNDKQRVKLLNAERPLTLNILRQPGERDRDRVEYEWLDVVVPEPKPAGENGSTPKAVFVGLKTGQHPRTGRDHCVVSVAKNSWAEESGVRVGDEICLVNGRDVEEIPAEELGRMARSVRPLYMTFRRRKADEGWGKSAGRGQRFLADVAAMKAGDSGNEGDRTTDIRPVPVPQPQGVAHRTLDSYASADAAPPGPKTPFSVVAKSSSPSPLELKKQEVVRGKKSAPVFPKKSVEAKTSVLGEGAGADVVAADLPPPIVPPPVVPALPAPVVAPPPVVPSPNNMDVLGTNTRSGGRRGRRGRGPRPDYNKPVEQDNRTEELFSSRRQDLSPPPLRDNVDGAGDAAAPEDGPPSSATSSLSARKLLTRIQIRAMIRRKRGRKESKDSSEQLSENANEKAVAERTLNIEKALNTYMMPPRDPPTLEAQFEDQELRRASLALRHPARWGRMRHLNATDPYFRRIGGSTGDAGAADEAGDYVPAGLELAAGMARIAEVRKSDRKKKSARATKEVSSKEELDEDSVRGVVEARIIR